MYKRLLMTLILVASVINVQALDLGWSASLGLGGAMALGEAVTIAAADFGATVGSEAQPAPILGAGFSVGMDLGLAGPWRIALALEARRLGLSYWAAASGDYGYLAVWTAGLRLGARYEPGPWFVGLGGLASAPFSPIAQGGGRGGVGVTASLGVESGRAFMPGAYLEGGLGLGLPLALGPLSLRPVLSLEAALWPGGAFDSMQGPLKQGVTAWQAALGLVLTLDIAQRYPR